MKHLDLSEALATMATLFSDARQTMFKAEVLQDYSAVDDGSSLRAWLAGDEQAARKLGAADPNLTTYRSQCLRSPAKITRVHVVQTPFTPYVAWEITVCYKDSLLAHHAETVLLAHTKDLADVPLPAGDFWIFDDKRVLQWEYDPGSGKTAGGKIWDEDVGDDIGRFRELQKILLTVAEPIRLGITDYSKGQQ